MCRTTDFPGFHPTRMEDDLLKIKAFYVRLSGLNAHKPAPESLTLLYPPRIDETELSLHGSKVRPDSTAFLTLDRVINAETKDGEAIFGSGERVRAGEGVRFEVYLGEDRILEGLYRRDDEEDWTLECKCGLESDAAVVAGADVAVAVEGQSALTERAEMVAKKNTRNGGKRAFNKRLQAIPEDREDVEDDDELDGGGGCYCDCGDYGSDGRDLEEACGPDCTRMEMDLEGVRWAVDVGIWIVSLGMGFLVSKASAKSLRRLRII